MIGQPHFSEMNFFRQGKCGGAVPPAQRKFGTPHFSETIGARKLKFYTRLDKAKYSFRCDSFFAKGMRGRSAPSVNLGPLISRKLLELES